jgi:hypothetical protein
MNILTSILLICAAGLTLAWLVAAERRLVAHAARRFAALPRLQQVAHVLAVGVMTVCAQKQRTVNSEQLTDAVAEAFGSDASHGDTESRSEAVEDSSNKVEAVSRPLPLWLRMFHRFLIRVNP